MKRASKGLDSSPRKGLRQLGIALALSATTFGAGAAGLGRLNLMSGLGQPLRAEIELTSLARDEAGTLTARLAGADAFSQAGIEYTPALATLRFSVQKRGNGTQYVLVTSTAQVNEPFLDLLVELGWGSGRLVREYTVLLDPPETRVPQAVDGGATIVQPQTQAAPTVVRRTPRTDGAPTETASTPLPAPAPVRRAPAAVPATSAVDAPGGTYVVQSGDTAMSIARANKADNVTLEQMLAALYRDNPQAFAGNINKLMAGATVKIPEAAAAQAVDAGEARRVIAQSANFGSYRERVARDAAQAPAVRAPGQQASGRLSTQVQDQAAPAATADRLQLSRPDATRATAAGATGTRNGAAGPTTEDLAAKDRELNETRTRLALLEKNVTDLQELLKLKNQTLADLQQKSAKAPDVASTPAPAAVAPAPAATVAPVTPPPPAATNPPAVAAPTPAEAPAAPAAATPDKVAPTPAPSTATTTTTTGTTGVTDWIVDNVLLVVGLVVLLAVLLGYFLMRRRKLSTFEDSIFVDNSVLHANSVFGTTGGQSVDTANSGFHSNFVPVAGNLPEHNEVDPVAEADVYIAYGRDAQAEEILKEALRADASRHAVRLKLLEIYAKRGDAKTFETMASELYAATGGQGDEWRQAAALGATIDPRNPLYGEPVVVEAAAPAARIVAAPATAPVAPPHSATDLGGDGLDFGMSSIGLTPTATGLSALDTTTKPSMDHIRTDPMPRGPAAAAPPEPAMDLDFDLGNAGGAGNVAPLQASPGESFDLDVGDATKSLIDPFTASAFGAADAASRTAVNLPAFRARADQPAEPASPQNPTATDGFTASDIFGSSIVADDAYAAEPRSSPTMSSIESAVAARTTDFRHAIGNQQFDKTEPLDAFSKINLELDQDDFPAVAGKSDFGGRTDLWQAMATKLDLALAYSDIGDKDGARELLEEVVRNGDQTQAERARLLITELG